MSVQLTLCTVPESICQDEESRLGYADAHYGRVGVEEERACVHYAHAYMPCIIAARLEKLKGPCEDILDKLL